jgi:hypothetical protein
MGVGPFAYFDQGSFASLNDKIWHKKDKLKEIKSINLLKPYIYIYIYLGNMQEPIVQIRWIQLFYFLVFFSPLWIMAILGHFFL